VDVLKRFDARLGLPDLCRELGISTDMFMSEETNTAAWMSS